MKTMHRKELMKMPVGTVYFEKGDNELLITDGTIGHVGVNSDWRYVMYDTEDGLLAQVRDGCFDDECEYVVYDDDDILKMYMLLKHHIND